MKTVKEELSKQKGDQKMKYEVSYRKKVEDWETPSEFWDRVNYPEPYIEEDCPEDAEETARAFILDRGDDPDKYEYLVTEYEE